MRQADTEQVESSVAKLRVANIAPFCTPPTAIARRSAQKAG
jgi:hypothetical protein